MIRYHPTVRQIHTHLELDRDHLRVNLHYSALKPIANALIVVLVVAKHLHAVPHVISLVQVWCFCEM